jgi:predicted metal-dependent HD superfamily phosphohydrolase
MSMDISYVPVMGHYHNLGHITHMLNLIPPNHPYARELTYTTCFHDCIYDPTAKHCANEKSKK